MLLWDERLQIGTELYAETMLQGGSLSLTGRERVAVERTTSAELLLTAPQRRHAARELGERLSLEQRELLLRPLHLVVDLAQLHLVQRTGHDCLDVADHRPLEQNVDQLHGARRQRR